MIPLLVPGHGDGYSEAAPLVALATQLATKARTYRTRGHDEPAQVAEWALTRLREAMGRTA